MTLPVTLPVEFARTPFPTVLSATWAQKAMPNSPSHPTIFLSDEQKMRCERWLDELLEKGVASEGRIERIRRSVQEGRIRAMDVWRLEQAGENHGVAAFTP